jgi:hypothetical protein
MGLPVAGTAKQAANSLSEKPAADELKILPQIQAILPPGREKHFLQHRSGQWTTFAIQPFSKPRGCLYAATSSTKEILR